MNKTALWLTGIMLGVNAFYCVLIYKTGENAGEAKTLDWLREKLEDAVESGK